MRSVDDYRAVVLAISSTQSRRTMLVLSQAGSIHLKYHTRIGAGGSRASLLQKRPFWVISKFDGQILEIYGVV